MISALINKTDNWELVRDQVAAILTTEVASQMALANDDGEDTELWRVRVYKERVEPWGHYLGSPEVGTIDAAPIVNVSFDASAFLEDESDYIEAQAADARLNLDVYGYGVAAGTDTGHVPADVKSANERDRAARLVRNILMAAEYIELGLAGTVSKRFIHTVTALDLKDAEQRPVQNVRAIRVVLGVKFTEYSPQIDLVNCSQILANVHTEIDGEVVFSVLNTFS